MEKNVNSLKLLLSKSIIEKINHGQVIFNLECKKPKFGLLVNEDSTEQIDLSILRKQFQRRKSL